jgi:hypothetical protein
MGYYIDWENAGGAAAIPLSACDPIKNARPKAVKWLMYTLLTHDFGIESSAEALGMDVDDTEEARQFWLDRGVISQTGANAAANTAANAENSVLPPIRTDVSRGKSDFLRPKDKNEINDIVARSPKLSYLFAQVQNIVPGDLTFTEQKTLIFIHEYYGITTNSILMLIDFAVSIGKYQNRSPAYVDYVAKDWAARGIFEHKEASEDIARLREYYSFEGRLASIFDVKIPFTSRESEFVAGWVNYDFYDDVFRFAYEVTVDKTGALKFAYLSKVLQSWYDKDLRNIDDIKAFNEQFLSEHADYGSVRGSRAKTEKAPKTKGAPSFDLSNAADEDLEAAVRGELG